MPRTRRIYALQMWTVEKRRRGWYYCRTHSTHRRRAWKGPYASQASVALMLARELKREILKRDGASP